MRPRARSSRGAATTAGAHLRRRRAGRLARVERAPAREPAIRADAPTRPGDPLLLYFTSARRRGRSWCCNTHASYPIGHLSTMYGLGLRPTTCISTFLRRAGPSTPGANVLRRGAPARPAVAVDAALRAARRPRHLAAHPDHLAVRPADRLAQLHPARSRSVERGVGAGLLFGPSRSIRT